MKKARVRNATVRDAGLFQKLWFQMLVAQSESGNIIYANEHNLDIYLGLFEAYVEEEAAGVVLFVADTGVLMWGEAGSPFETAVGLKPCTGWGQFVSPEARGKGVLDAMIGEAVIQLADLGFDSMIGATTEEYGLNALKRNCEVTGTPERPCYVKF